MRDIVYIPIVHAEADMGLAAEGMEQKSAALAGERRWRFHRETIDRFWDMVGNYLRSIVARKLKVYQDGLPAGGAIGRRIAEEAARSGSRNYQLVLDLLERGAELCLTEDPVLLRQEQQDILEQLKREQMGSGQNAEHYRQRREQLIEQRDRFVAATINATLKQGEMGVLFMGAAHNVLHYLDADITVHKAKEPEQLRTYLEELFHGQDDRKLEAMSQAITSPIEIE